MKLTYHGHSAWEVQTGGAHIWIDPFLSQNPRADVDPEDIQADYLIVLATPTTTTWATPRPSPAAPAPSSSA